MNKNCVLTPVRMTVKVIYILSYCSSSLNKQICINFILFCRTENNTDVLTLKKTGQYD